MLAKVCKIGKIKVKVYKDIVDYVTETACKDFDEIFSYILRYQGEDEDYYYYSIELPLEMLDKAMDEIKNELDKWIQSYKEKGAQKENSTTEEEYIWE